jgi:hypothetical protein
LQGYNLDNTTHEGLKGTTSGNSSWRGQGDDQGPPHPSARLPRVCLADAPWVAHALSHYTAVRYGRIASISETHDATQFGDSICPICVSAFQMFFQQGSADAGFSQHRRGLPPLSYEYQIRPLIILLIQYSQFFANCPAWCLIMPTIR